MQGNDNEYDTTIALAKEITETLAAKFADRPDIDVRLVCVAMMTAAAGSAALYDALTKQPNARQLWMDAFAGVYDDIKSHQLPSSIAQ